MRSANYRKYVYHALLGFICILLYLWESSVFAFPTISSVRALPLMSFVICISIYNPETPATVYGLIAGVAMDIGRIHASGFNAIFMLIACVACGLFIRLLLNRTLLCALVLSFFVCFIYFFTYWLFFCRPDAAADSGYCLIRYYLPMAVYTWVFTLPFYLIVGAMTRKFRVDDRVLL